MDLARERSAVSRLPLSGRLREMHGRLARRLEKAGLDELASEQVLEAHAAALLHRLEVLGDDEHFEALHPSRTMLILLDDCDVVDATVLQAAPGVESEHDPLRPAGVDGLAAAVPRPGTHGERLLEELVAASGVVRLLALAERLDHARHLHLRERPAWAPFHTSFGAVYLPIAHRTHPRLARRYDWWWRMFRRRFLEGGKGA